FWIDSKLERPIGHRLGIKTSAEFPMDAGAQRCDSPGWRGVPDLEKDDTDGRWPLNPAQDVCSACHGGQGLQSDSSGSGRLRVQRALHAQGQKNERSLRPFRPLALPAEQV